MQGKSAQNDPLSQVSFLSARRAPEQPVGPGLRFFSLLAANTGSGPRPTTGSSNPTPPSTDSKDQTPVGIATSITLCVTPSAVDRAD
ncbi:hypothetical protein KIPB_009510, partial [Kipferlia bialata]|eukprot:g9510.t1